MKKQKENSREGITWSEMGKQNVQAEKVYWSRPHTESNNWLSEEFFECNACSPLTYLKLYS